MSSIDILAAAASSLFATQAQIGVVTENIGNAQSTNYTERNAVVVPASLDSSDSGQSVQITRAVNQALQSEVLGQTSSAGGTDYLSSLYSQLEQLTGSSTGTPSLASAMQTLVSAFQAFQATPENTAAEQSAVSAATGLVQTIQQISQGVQQIQVQVEGNVTTDVGNLNTELTQIQQWNTSIVQLQASGGDPSNLEDQRDAVVSQVAQYLPVRQQVSSDGSISLFTPSGVTLVSGKAVSFAYDAASNTFYDAADPNKTSLNAALTNGKLGAELNVLRTDPTAVQSTDPSMAPLEKIREQLDSFSNLLYAAPPATPTALQSAYDGAGPANTGELASSLFTYSSTPPNAPADTRDYIEVNPALSNGTAVLKQAAAEPVLAQLTAATNSFSSGDVTATGATYVQIAGDIASAQTLRATTATNASQAADTNLSAATQSYRNATGVSVDQQLSKLVVLQNAYNASAKIISIYSSLEQTLFSAIPSA